MTKVCPKCGSKNMAFITRTDAYFTVNEDGSMGAPILDNDGISCITEMASTSYEDMEFKCLDCRSSFCAPKGERDNVWKKGEEI